MLCNEIQYVRVMHGALLGCHACAVDTLPAALQAMRMVTDCMQASCWTVSIATVQTMQHSPHHTSTLFACMCCMHSVGYLHMQVGWHARSNAAGGEVQTPRLDALAADGIVLHRTYAFKYCSPTRCAIQSGRNPIHVNVDNAVRLKHAPIQRVCTDISLPLVEPLQPPLVTHHQQQHQYVLLSTTHPTKLERFHSMDACVGMQLRSAPPQHDCLVVILTHF